MVITQENYFNKEANKEYLGSSQYKDFAGSLGKIPCEAQALAKLSGEWEQESTTALLVGSYVDAHYEGTLDVFKAQHPELLTKSGSLKSDFKYANEIIARTERDKLFQQYMSGKKQVIMTAEMFGAKWKIKIDSYLEDKAIVDLKVMASITKANWIRDMGYVNFIDFWGYDLQAAIYQKVVELNTGKKLPFFIAAASKEKPQPNIEVIFIPQRKLDEALYEVEKNIPRILQLKSGDIEPHRCEMCDYCRFTKELQAPIHYDKLLMDI